MASNLRILATNLHDTATLTATSEALPISNTQRSERSRVWRSTNLQTQEITATLPTGGYVDCIALARHNLGAEGRVQFQFFRGEYLVHDSGPMPTAMLLPAGVWRAGIDPWGATYNDQLPGETALAIYWLGQPVAVDRYTCTIESVVDDPEAYFEIGRIFSGLSFSPSVNMNWGGSVRWVDTSEHVRTEAGSLRTVGAHGLHRIFSLQLDWLSEIDRQRLVTELARAGKGQDLLVSLYPQSGGLKELEHTLVCRRATDVAHTHSHFQNWKSTFEFEEV